MVDSIVNKIKESNHNIINSEKEVISEALKLVNIHRDGLDNHPDYILDLETIITLLVLSNKKRNKEVELTPLVSAITSFNDYFNESIENAMPFEKSGDFNETHFFGKFYITDLYE